MGYARQSLAQFAGAPGTARPQTLPAGRAVIDESHNLRNPEGKTYRAIREYLQTNDSMVVLLSATPYNKTYLDLSSQLGLFVEEDRSLGIRRSTCCVSWGRLSLSGGTRRG